MDPDPVTAEEKREVVDRVLQSKGFQRAAKLREFLRYVCEKALSPGGDCAVREQDIGMAVYLRPANYNPSEDNIVRVEARNLRRKLDEFFGEEGEGKDLPVVIKIPRGTYIPEFGHRDALKPEHSLAEPLPRAAEVSDGKPFRLSLAMGLLAALLAIATGILFFQNQSLKARLGSAGPPPVQLWSSLFDDRHNTYLVLADASFPIIQDILGRDLRLSDYLQRGYAGGPGSRGRASETERAIRILAQPLTTNMVDIRFVTNLFRLPGVSRDRLSVRSARELAPLDLKGNHLILVGSVRSNPWIELFESKLNFYYEFDFKRSQAVIRNRSPRLGERSSYEAGGKDGKSDEIYSTVTFLPNLSKDGNVLIVSGTRGQGTEAATEMIFNHETMSGLIRQLQLQQTGHMRYFELLLKAAILGKSSKGAVEIVAYRILPA